MMSQYSDDTFEAASSRGGIDSRRNSFDDENYENDFLEESQQEFESSVIENYDDDVFEKDEQEDGQEDGQKSGQEDDEAIPIIEKTLDNIDPNNATKPVVLSGAFPSPMSNNVNDDDATTDVAVTTANNNNYNNSDNDIVVNLPPVTDPYILHLINEAKKEKKRKGNMQIKLELRSQQELTTEEEDLENTVKNSLVSATSTTLGGGITTLQQPTVVPTVTLWDQGRSVEIPMDEFMIASQQQPQQVHMVDDEVENDLDMRMASAMATQMVAEKLGATDDAGFDLVHSLMEKMLQTSVNVGVVGEETDLSKFQDADEVSQLPSDLPGAMLSSSDEDDDCSMEIYGGEHKNEKNGMKTTPKRDDDNQVTKNLMGKMLGSMSDLHGDLWETVLGEEDSGISATPDRLDVPPVSTAWGEKTTLNNISTSPLNSSTKSKLSSLSDKDRIPLDRIARIMRGNDNLQSSVTSSITSSVWSSDEEEEESLEEITL